MKKILILLAAIMTLPMSCSKENGTVNDPLTSEEYEYSGKMTVTASGVENVSENVEVDVILDEKTKTASIGFEDVKFVPQMPVTLDVTIPEVSYVEKDGQIEFSGDGIVPLSGGILPFPKYTVTALSGTLTKSRLRLTLNFGDYPVTYEGTSDR